MDRLTHHHNVTLRHSKQRPAVLRDRLEALLAECQAHDELDNREILWRLEQDGRTRKAGFAVKSPHTGGLQLQGLRNMLSLTLEAELEGRSCEAPHSPRELRGMLECVDHALKGAWPERREPLARIPRWLPQDAEPEYLISGYC